MRNKLFLLACLSAVLAGCAYPSPGAQPGETPPQIVLRNDAMTWDNPGAFGPVPGEMAETAAKVCATLDTEKVQHEARGYHPKAMNLEGQPFAGGGYYCTPKR